MGDELASAAPPLGRRRVLVQIALAVFGLAVIGYYLATVDRAAMGAALGRVAVWLPVLLALEGARIAIEAVGTRALYGLGRDRLPTGALLRAHVVGYGLAFYMPAGRAAAEAIKATLLARWSTPARAAAVAAANQSLALLGLAIAAATCAVVTSTVDGTGRLVASLVAVAATTGALAVVVRVATLRLPTGVLARFVPRIARTLGAAQREIPAWLPWRTLGTFLVTRALQVGSAAVMLHALVGDVTVVGAVIVTGVGLVGASVGDLVPGQFGATDATFAVSAELIGLTHEAALAIALVTHVVQMSWLGLGVIAELVLGVRARRRERSA